MNLYAIVFGGAMAIATTATAMRVYYEGLSLPPRVLILLAMGASFGLGYMSGYQAAIEFIYRSLMAAQQAQ